MAIREGKWRCPYCSGVNRGAHLACGACGATRDKDVTFFLEDDAPEVTDESLVVRARAGADWLCHFCGASNPPDRDRCRNCGAERGTATARAVIEPGGASGAPPGPPARVFRGGEMNSPPLISRGRFATPSGVNPAPLAAVAPRLSPRVAAAVLLLVAFVVAAAYFGLRRTEETLTVAGFEWERKVAVEAWRTVREQAWEGSVPSQARVFARRREVHHTERDQVGTRRVKSGTRDLGNGFFEDVYRDEPVLSGKRTYRMELPEARWAVLQPGQPVSAVIRGGWSVLELKQ